MPGISEVRTGNAGSALIRHTYVGRLIRRSNRHLLAVNAAFLGGLLLSAIASERYLYNCFRGPLKVSEAQLALMDPADMRRYFVSLDNELPLYYVQRKIWTSEGPRIMNMPLTTGDAGSHYYAAQFGKLIVIVKSGEQTRHNGYEAALLPLPAELAKWAANNGLDPRRVASDGTVFFPYLMDGTDFRRSAYWFLAIGAFVALLATYNVTNAFRRERRLEASPLFRQLRRFDTNPETVAWSIERESKEGRLCLGATWLMQSWLIQERFFSCIILRLKDVVSIRENVTRDPELPESHSVHVTDKERRTIRIRRESEYLMKDLVESLRKQAPSAKIYRDSAGAGVDDTEDAAGADRGSSP